MNACRERSTGFSSFGSGAADTESTLMGDSPNVEPASCLRVANRLPYCPNQVARFLRQATRNFAYLSFTR